MALMVSGVTALWVMLAAKHIYFLLYSVHDNHVLSR